MKVAVIGAGLSGLFSIKCCLEEGLEPTCFEEKDRIGGLWNYNETPEEGRACLYENVVLNGSRDTHTFSDFYPANDERDYWPTAAQYLQYIQDYCRHFGLEKCIKFKHHVLSVEPSHDHRTSKSWLVTWSCGDERKTERFDAVMVGSGRYVKPVLPDIPGLNKFKNACYHSSRYRNNRQEDIKGRDVLVVGNAFTASEISAAMADTANKVWLSIGKGCNLISRSVCAPGTVGTDSLMLQRWRSSTSDPIQHFNNLLIQISESTLPDQKKYNITPGGFALFRPIMVSRDLAEKIPQGKVTIKPTVTEMTEDAVKFSDGSEVRPDTIYLATGYEIDFPFLSKEIVAESSPELQLYKQMWPLDHQNLVFIGSTVNFFAPYTYYFELQARWFVQVIQGKCRLPSRQEMAREVKTRRDNVIAASGLDRGQTDVTMTDLCDFIAERIGAMPNWWKLVLTDPYMAYIFRYGPVIACHYRLVGPNRWPDARRTAVARYEAWRRLKGDGWNWSLVYGVGLGLVALAGAAAWAKAV